MIIQSNTRISLMFRKILLELISKLNKIRRSTSMPLVLPANKISVIKWRYTLSTLNNQSKMRARICRKHQHTILSLALHNKVASSIIKYRRNKRRWEGHKVQDMLLTLQGITMSQKENALKTTCIIQVISTNNQCIILNNTRPFTGIVLLIKAIFMCLNTCIKINITHIIKCPQDTCQLPKYTLTDTKATTLYPVEGN